ncbi:hypothetical protein [Mycolicibacterium smegmatis]|uniref:hypothetical protein n=1 Tax=Mycolicibacterium smegmatis TaxID=1772 RepID=UPI001EFA666D|nr:hypothetical protein [Mycolicibacterium smegmatis]ULN32867.1 hypothetical protein KZ781_18485 [Mycolicibacterium smegmatis]
MQVSFAAVRNAVQSAGAAARIEISGNLGTPPGSPIIDPSGESTLQALKAGTASQVVVVNLGDGQQWWQTRLLLASGMSRHSPGGAIVFTALIGEHPDRFVGWAPSAAVLKCLLASNNSLRRAYLSALRDTNLAGLGTPADWDHPERGLDCPVAVTPGKNLPTPAKFDDFICERMLFGRVLELEGGDLGCGDVPPPARLEGDLSEFGDQSNRFGCVCTQRIDPNAVFLPMVCSSAPHHN